MNVGQLLFDTLKPLGVPVSYGVYNNTANTYIVFNEYNQAPWLSADDEELFTKHFFQVDVFSKTNYTKLVKDIRRLMKEAGFGRMFESETYEPEMGRMRKILRFSYISKGDSDV